MYARTHWLPLVFGPALAIERIPGPVCRSTGDVKCIVSSTRTRTYEEVETYL